MMLTNNNMYAFKRLLQNNLIIIIKVLFSYIQILITLFYRLYLFIYCEICIDRFSKMKIPGQNPYKNCLLQLYIFKTFSWVRLRHLVF